MNASLIFDACLKVLEDERKPLEVWRVSKATGLDEETLMAMLIRETETRPGSYVEFRYPSLPCAAITKLRASYPA